MSNFALAATADGFVAVWTLSTLVSGPRIWVAWLDDEGAFIRSPQPIDGAPAHQPAIAVGTDDIAIAIADAPRNALNDLRVLIYDHSGEAIEEYRRSTVEGFSMPTLAFTGASYQVAWMGVVLATFAIHGHAAIRYS